jgi:uncharacterized membrane protein required for colicin V production
LDWAALLAVLLFALQGIREGALRQICSLLGWLGGYVSFIAVSQWVGAHWLGARPAVVFAVLRWLVALLAGTAVLAIFQLIGERAGVAAHKSVFGGLDRLGGFIVGIGYGALVVVVMLVVLLLTPWPREAARWATEAHVTQPLLAKTRSILAVDDRIIPGLKGVRHALDRASLRARFAPRHS